MAKEIKKCQERTEVFSRCVGFYRPVQQFNKGKQAEFHNRKMYDIKEKVLTPGEIGAMAGTKLRKALIKGENK